MHRFVASHSLVSVLTLCLIGLLVQALPARGQDDPEVCLQAYDLSNTATPDHELIISLYTECLSADLPPERAAIYYVNRANSHDELGHTESALQDYDKAQELGFNHPLLFYNRGIVYDNLGRYQEAIEDFQQAIRIEPQLEAAYVRLGMAYTTVGRPDLAVAQFDRAILLTPEDDEAYDSRAVATIRLGDFKSALRDLENAIRLNPMNAGAHEHMGTALVALGDYRAALSSYEQSLLLDPSYPDPYNNIAWLLATCPDPAFHDGPRALEMARKSMELRASGSAFDTLAAAYARDGQFEEAATNQSEAIRLVKEQGWDPAVIAQFEQRLRLYRQGQAYIDEP